MSFVCLFAALLHCNYYEMLTETYVRSATVETGSMQIKCGYSISEIKLSRARSVGPEPQCWRQ